MDNIAGSPVEGDNFLGVKMLYLICEEYCITTISYCWGRGVLARHLPLGL